MDADPPASPSDAAGWFALAVRLSTGHLSVLIDRDWSRRASGLEWSCRDTLDHMVDCIFSYGMQLAARRQSDWLPWGELHSLPGATPNDLIEGFTAAGVMFEAVLGSCPPTVRASDGVVLLSVSDWAARASYETLLHTADIAGALGSRFEPPAPLCAWMNGSTGLWMFDRERAAASAHPWEQTLLGSGRASR
jgi:hypothetical protein